MSSEELATGIITNLPYTPNSQQSALIGALAAFCAGEVDQNSVFLLNGYAGTGKTSVMGALVKALGDFNRQSVLLAPTGRAAKVFGRFARHPAYTIHRHIYRTDFETGRFNSLKENKAKRGTLFIVDEASMISGVDNDNEGLNLLDDLISFVYSGDNCRLILLGDTAQLPPVGSAISKAMQPKHLKSYGLHVLRVVLTATVRQSAMSGILFNATWLRRAMQQEKLPEPKLFLERFNDARAVGGEDLIDELSRSYSKNGIEDTIVITRSNRRAVQYNMAIRNQLLERDELLSVGDIIMVAKNNYFWSKSVKGLDFIANGDMAIVEKILSTERLGSNNFSDVVLSFPDHDGVTIEAKVNLDCLTSETPSLSSEEMSRLYQACLDNPDRYPAGTPDSIRIRGLRTDPYFNALQIKYGYAVTCHKAQGGQWKSVFVDVGNVGLDTADIEFYRWLYTATTRAEKNIWYINPDRLIS